MAHKPQYLGRLRDDQCGEKGFNSPITNLASRIPPVASGRARVTHCISVQYSYTLRLACSMELHLQSAVDLGYVKLPLSLTLTLRDTWTHLCALCAGAWSWTSHTSQTHTGDSHRGPRKQ